MADITQLLTQQLDGKRLSQVSRQVGADRDNTGQALSAAVPLLITALANNASQPQGAQELHSALVRDHDGTILNNMDDFLNNPQAANGAGILRHVLGGQRGTIEKALAEATGLDAATVGQVLEIAAPLVMGALGQEQRQQGLDPDGLSDLLGQQRQAAQAANPTLMSVLTGLLDSNKDGSVLDDIFRLAGKLFGGRR
jgi:hypothetical protein